MLERREGSQSMIFHTCLVFPVNYCMQVVRRHEFPWNLRNRLELGLLSTARMMCRFSIIKSTSCPTSMLSPKYSTVGKMCPHSTRLIFSSQTWTNIQERLRALQAGSYVILFTRCVQKLFTDNSFRLLHRCIVETEDKHGAPSRARDETWSSPHYR